MDIASYMCSSIAVCSWKRYSIVWWVKYFLNLVGLSAHCATSVGCVKPVVCKLVLKRPALSLLLLSLQITKKQCCWSGALRLGFTSKDPSRINPDTLPKYACPDLVSQSGFWAKALPEEFANEGNIIAFWVDKKGRVFYRVNDSAAMLFFSGVRTAEPLWALIDVYGLTRGVQLLGEYLGVSTEVVLRHPWERASLTLPVPSLCWDKYGETAVLPSRSISAPQPGSVGVGNVARKYNLSGRWGTAATI